MKYPTPDQEGHYWAKLKLAENSDHNSADLIVCEFTEASMLFDVTAGVMTRLSHTEDFGGFIGVTVTCKKCRHAWKPRGANQVIDLLSPSTDPG